MDYEPKIGDLLFFNPYAKSKKNYIQEGQFGIIIDIDDNIDNPYRYRIQWLDDLDETNNDYKDVLHNRNQYLGLRKMIGL